MRKQARHTVFCVQPHCGKEIDFNHERKRWYHVGKTSTIYCFGNRATEARPPREWRAR